MDIFFHSLNPLDGSIHKLNHKLLHKHLSVHPLIHPTHSAKERAELFTGIFINHFALNLGITLPDVSASLQRINETNTTNTYFTTLGTVEYPIKHLNFPKARGANHITNTMLKCHIKLVAKNQCPSVRSSYSRQMNLEIFMNKPIYFT